MIEDRWSESFLRARATPTASNVTWVLDFSAQDTLNMERTGTRCTRLANFERIIEIVKQWIAKGDLDEYLHKPIQQLVYESLPIGGSIWNRIIKSIPKPQDGAQEAAAIPLPPPPQPPPNTKHPLQSMLVKMMDIGFGVIANTLTRAQPEPSRKTVPVHLKMPKLDMPRAIIPRDEPSPKPQPEKKEDSEKEKT